MAFVMLSLSPLFAIIAFIAAILVVKLKMKDYLAYASEFCHWILGGCPVQFRISRDVPYEV